MLGLIGQQAAYAAATPVGAVPASVSEMNADCMEMMQEQQPQPAEKPCKGLTPDCIAVMGCVVPVVLIKEPAAPLAGPSIRAMLAFWPATSVLVGNNLPPETHPPTILG